MPRTSAGRDFQSDAMFGNTASRPTVAQIMALSESTASPAAPNTHTVMSGTTGNEMSADGFGRKVAVYTHTTGQQTSTLQATFTHSGAAGAGTARTPRLAGIFAQANGGTPPGAVDTGILVIEESVPNPPPLTGTDSLNMTMLLDFGTLT